MTRQLIHQRLHLLFAALVAFCLPLNKLTPVCIALLALNWLLEGDFRLKFIRIRIQLNLWVFLFFYALLIIGMLYTQNTRAGAFDLQVKASLFIFPILLATKPIPSSEQRWVLAAFLLGIFSSTIYMLSVAIREYLNTGLNHFFYQEFSILIHPSYLSMYINFAMAWLLYLTLQKDVFPTILFKVSVAFVLIFLVLVNILLASKMGLLTMGLLFVGFSVYYTVTRRRFVLGVLGIAAVALLFFLIVRLAPEVAGRINRAIAAVEYDSGDDHAASESTSVRMLVWSAANSVIAEHFLFGVGTGDVKDELMKEYEKKGISNAMEHRLNAHNQYYQVFISLGLAGFLSFLACLLLPLRQSIIRKQFVYFVFLILVMINLLAESMLETQAGVLFYAFFNAMLCFEATQRSDL